MLKAIRTKLKPHDDQLVEVALWLNKLRLLSNYAKNERSNAYSDSFTEGQACYLRTKAAFCPLTCSVAKHNIPASPDNSAYKRSTVKKNSQHIMGDYCDTRTKAWVMPLTCDIGWNPVTDSAKNTQIKNLVSLKKSRPWYSSINSTVLQQELINVNTAFDKFFKGESSYPRTKTKSQFKSFRSSSTGIKWNDRAIYLPSLGWMRHFCNEELPKYKDKKVTLKSATFTLEADGLYVSLLFDFKKVPDYPSVMVFEILKVIGCDMGLTKYLHCSDGEQFDNPRFATNKKSRRQLRIRSRRLARKKKGSQNKKRKTESNNRKKERNKLARTHKKVRDRRDAFLWHLAKKLIDKVGVNGCLVFENLNVKGMMKRCKPKKDERGRFLKNGQSRKRGLNRSISDASWGKFFTIMEYMCKKHGVYFLQVNPKNSSNTCSNCGTVDKESRNKEKFVCTHCGHMDHADIGAAREIRRRGMAELGIG